MATPAAPAASDAAAVAQVTATIEAAVRARYPDASTVQVTLRSALPVALRACPSAPAIDLRGQRPNGNVALHLRCVETGAAAYVPGWIEVHIASVVAARPLAAGAALTAADLQLQDEPIHASQGFRRVDDLLGARLRQAVRVGERLQPRHVERPPTIAAGEQLVLYAGGRGIQVSAPAEALQAGQLGQQIRVRNLASGRVVAAWVTGRGAASTRPPSVASAATVPTSPP